MGWSIGYDERWKRDIGITLKSFQFYTYIWLRKDGTPYYVGKGSGDRAFKRRWRRTGYPPPSARIIITYHKTEELAYAAEKALILQYGRKDLGTGCLANLTAGGENPPNHTGKKRSAEWHRKQSLIKKGRPGIKQSLETCDKRRRAMLGRTFSAESLKLMSLAQMGKRHTPESKKRMSLTRTGKYLGIPWSGSRRAAHERAKECHGR